MPLKTVLLSSLVISCCKGADMLRTYLKGFSIDSRLWKRNTYPSTLSIQFHFQHNYTSGTEEKFLILS